MDYHHRTERRVVVMADTGADRLRLWAGVNGSERMQEWASSQSPHYESDWDAPVLALFAADLADALLQYVRVEVTHTVKEDCECLRCQSGRLLARVDAWGQE